MSLSSKYDAGNDRRLHKIAQCNLPFWMALMNVYRTGMRVNCFFGFLQSRAAPELAGQPCHNLLSLYRMG